MKKKLLIYLFWAIMSQVAFAQKNDSKLDRAREEISSYLQGKDAKFGIACIYDGKDTLQINGNKDFPMLSVYNLAKPLLTTNAILSHKTGTGGLNSQNRIIGINDVGFVRLPNNHSYSIAVFIADSNYNTEITSSFIADISEIIWRNLQ